jgi:hypothetical protein
MSASGCAVSTKVTPTERSSIEQQLLTRSLERAIAQIDVRKFTGKTLTVDLYGLTNDRDFAKEFVVTRLQENGARVIPDAQKADVQSKFFLSALGVDRSEGLLGVPAFAIPVIGVPIPEIALFKSVRNRGIAEIQMYAFDSRNGKFLSKSPAVGIAKYDDYTIMIMINFNSTDLNESPEEEKDDKSVITHDILPFIEFGYSPVH